MDCWRCVASQYLTKREVCRGYVWQLLKVAGVLDSLGIRPGEDSQQSVDRINLWLRSLHCSSTRHNYRRLMITLFREQSPGTTIAGKLLRVKAIIPPPQAYNPSEVFALFSAAKSQQGVFLKSRCPRNLWCLTFLQLLYETGIRYGDAYNLQQKSVRDGRLAITVHKTGLPIHHRISNELQRGIDQLSELSTDDSVFSWAVSPRWAREAMSKVWKTSKLPGSPKWMRRTAATLVEAQQPGMAKNFLGHASYGLAEKFYIDRSMLPNNLPSPPRVSLSPDSSGHLH